RAAGRRSEEQLHGRSREREPGEHQRGAFVVHLPTINGSPYGSGTETTRWCPEKARCETTWDVGCGMWAPLPTPHIPRLSEAADHGNRHVAHDLQRPRRHLVDRVLRRMPPAVAGAVVEVHDVDGGDPRPLQRHVVAGE